MGMFDDLIPPDRPRAVAVDIEGGSYMFPGLENIDQPMVRAANPGPPPLPAAASGLFEDLIPANTNSALTNTPPPLLDAQPAPLSSPPPGGGLFDDLIPQGEVPYKRNILQRFVTDPLGRGWNRLQQGIDMIGGTTGLQTPEATVASLGQNERDLAQYPVSPGAQKGIEDITASTSWPTLLGNLVKNPEAVWNTIVESAANSVPSMAGGAIGSGAGALAAIPSGGAIAPVTVPAGLAVGTGLGSFGVDYGSTLLSELQKAGVDFNDGPAVAAKLGDPAFMAAAKDSAVRHGIPVAIFDALSAGLAGRIIGPLKGASLPVRAAGAGGEIAMQAGLGAGGEATGQIAQSGKITSPSDVALEAIGELVPGIAETVIGTAAHRTKGPPTLQAAPPAAIAPEMTNAPQPGPNTPQPAANGQNVPNAPLVQNPDLAAPANPVSAPILDQAPVMQDASPSAPEIPLDPRTGQAVEIPQQNQQASDLPAASSPVVPANPAINPITSATPQVTAATPEVNNAAPQVNPVQDLVGTSSPDQVNGETNIDDATADIKKPTFNDGHIEEENPEIMRYLDGLRGRTQDYKNVYKRWEDTMFTGKVDRMAARASESEVFLQELHEKIRALGFKDRSEVNASTAKDKPEALKLTKMSSELAGSMSRFVGKYAKSLRGAKDAPTAEQLQKEFESFEAVYKQTLDYLEVNDATRAEAVKPPAAVAKKPKSQLTAKAAKQDLLDQLDTIRVHAQSEIGVNDVYSGPREATLTTPSGKKTLFKVTSSDPKVAAEQATEMIRRLGKRPQKTFAMKMPAGEASALPESVIDESRGAPGDNPQPAGPKKGPSKSPEGESRVRKFKAKQLSMRRGIWDEAGIDPAIGENMPPMKQFKTLSAVIEKKYGVGVVLGKTANMADALNNLKDMYVELQVMANLAKIPETAIGLKKTKISASDKPINRQLKIMFSGALRGVLGVYMRDKNLIIQPERARSLAHEWAHALDYFILDAMGKTTDALERHFRGYTARVRQEGEDYTPSTVSEAWIDLLNTMFFDEAFAAGKIMELEQKIERARSPKSIEEHKAQIEKVKSGNYRGKDFRSRYYKGAKTIPSGSDKNYWTRPTEMWARAFEAYIAREAEKSGQRADLITADAGLYDRSSSGDEMFNKMYPQDADRDRIFAAIGTLMNRIAASDILETESGVPAAAPADDNFADPLRWFKHMPGYTEPAASVKQALLGTKEERAELMRTTKSMLGFLREDRPSTPLTFLRASHNLFMANFSAMGRQLRVIEARNKSATLTKMINAVWGDPGRGRYTGQRFDQIESRMRDKYYNTLARIIAVNKLKRHDKAQMAALRDLLLGVTDTVPAKLQGQKAQLVSAARGMREMWDGIYAELRDNYGVDIGYIKDEHTNYINRVDDLAYIFTHRKESIEQFTQAYILKYQEEEKRGELVDKPKDFDIKTQAAIDAETHVNALRSANAIAGFMPPANRISKRRTFPGSADLVLKEVRIQNPLEALEIYIANGASRAAYTKLLEPKEGAFAEAFKQMEREGVDPIDAAQAQDLILTAIGKRAQGGVLKASQKTGDYLNALLTMTMLARAPFASLGEPAAAGFRTGDFRDSFRIWSLSAQEILQKADSKDREDILQAYGIIENNLYSLSVAEREGNTYENNPKVQLMMRQFFRRNLMTPLTDFQRKVATRLGQVYFLRMANALNNPQEKPDSAKHARAEFREIGIAPDRIDAFADYLIKRDGALPDLEGARGAPEEFHQLWANSLMQFTWDVIQNPKNINRSWAANTAVGRFVYGFLSFTAGFYESLIKRSIKVTAQKYKEGGIVPASQHLLMGVLAPYAVYYMAATAAFTLRTLLLNSQGFKDKDDDEKLDYLMTGGLAYTSPAGPLADIIFNVWKGIKYDKSFSDAFVGKLNYFFDIFNTYKEYMTHNSANNDKQERKALEATYRMFVMPALAIATAVAPVTDGIGTLFGMANMWAGSRDAQETLSDSVYGPEPPPKGKKKKK